MFVQLCSIAGLVLATTTTHPTPVATAFELSHRYIGPSSGAGADAEAEAEAGAGTGADSNVDIWSNYNAMNNEPANTRNSSDDLIYLATKPIDPITADSSDEEVEVGLVQQRIDLSDFIALIPANQVQDIVANYYAHDREVQRAYTYLRSKDFAHLKARIVAIPEVNAFLKYLNASGLDLVGFMDDLSKVGGNPEKRVVALGEGVDEESTRTTTPATPSEDSLNGLHGLVDSILDILPQDQLLTLFFDKNETSEEFSYFVDSIGTQEFSRILQDMEHSVELKNLVYALHNNGIYVTRIVDSLKAYFFLGSF